MRCAFIDERAAAILLCQQARWRSAKRAVDQFAVHWPEGGASGRDVASVNGPSDQARIFGHLFGGYGFGHGAAIVDVNSNDAGRFVEQIWTDEQVWVHETVDDGRCPHIDSLGAQVSALYGHGSTFTGDKSGGC